MRCRLAIRAVVTALVGMVAAPVVALAAGAGVGLVGRIDGVSLSAGSGEHPVRLDPGRVSTIDVLVHNGSRSTIDGRTLTLSGAVMGLTFFSFQTSIDLAVLPGQTGELRFPLDLGGLDGQATGLIPASMTLRDGSHHVLAAEATVVDVRGSLWSVYGLFGLTVAVLTALALVSLLLAVARHRLPENRWRRALRFLPLGAGAGLVGIFTLSATRVFTPTARHWVPILVVAVVASLVAGWLSPAPGAEPEDEVVEPVEVEAPAEAVVAVEPEPDPAPVPEPAAADTVIVELGGVAIAPSTSGVARRRRTTRRAQSAPTVVVTPDPGVEDPR